MGKMKMAIRLTVAQSMQKRMMPRQRRKVPPPPAGTTIAAAPPSRKPIHQAPTQRGFSGVISVLSPHIHPYANDSEHYFRIY
uniref:Uncharacterized protein n=1 Tax=Hippocampus comes TaxID=109280 RepID=A0A3Q3D5E3_HIPCM